MDLPPSTLPHLLIIALIGIAIVVILALKFWLVSWLWKRYRRRQEDVNGTWWGREGGVRRDAGARGGGEGGYLGWEREERQRVWWV